MLFLADRRRILHCKKELWIDHSHLVSKLIFFVTTPEGSYRIYVLGGPGIIACGGENLDLALPLPEA